MMYVADVVPDQPTAEAGRTKTKVSAIEPRARHLLGWTCHKTDDPVTGPGLAWLVSSATIDKAKLSKSARRTHAHTHTVVVLVLVRVANK